MLMLMLMLMLVLVLVLALGAELSIAAHAADCKPTLVRPANLADNLAEFVPGYSAGRPKTG